MNRVFVTGATGFIGRALVLSLSARNDTCVLAGVRAKTSGLPSGVTQIAGCELRADASWLDALRGVTQVVHSAWADVRSVSHDDDNDPVRWETNVVGSLRLAEQAASAGIRRFVFISTAKVNGEITPIGRPFGEGDLPQPRDSYAQAKLEVERRLMEVSKDTGMEVVIIRPPLVYGPGVRGNFRRLLVAIASEKLLPLALVNNRRSMVSLDNLANFVVVCILHPKAANHVFLISDGDDLSSPELIRKLARSLHKPCHLVPIPIFLIKTVAVLLGKREVARRVLGSLQVDIGKARGLLEWNPSVSVDEALDKVVAAFINDYLSGN